MVKNAITPQSFPSASMENPPKPSGIKRETSEEYRWQKQRLKPESERLPGASFVRGYGPVGQYSMYLPSPVTEKKIIFRDGKPSAEFAGSCLDIPEIRAARDKVLECAAKRMPFAELLADLVLVEYSVVLLRTQYNLTDPDLEMLHSGKRWHQPLIVHAMGGKDVVDSLRRIDPQRISEIISDAENRLHGYAVLAGNSPEPSESVETEVAKIVAAGETIEDFDPTEL
jgi:hypothetical protein